MRLIIIGCGKSKIWDKHSEAGPQKAEDVYTSGFAMVKREYARSQGCNWMILSAKYGFIRPDFVIPGAYSVTFNDLSTCPISVAELKSQVEEQGLNRYDEVTAVGGIEYIEGTKAAFAGTRTRVDAPFERHRMGEQMHMMREEIDKGKPLQQARRVPASGQTSVSPVGGLSDAGTTGTVNADTFRRALRAIFDESEGNFVDVISGALHDRVGGRNGRNHRMATCCSVMMAAKRDSDTILSRPPKGKGATLTIRYFLPR